MAAATAIPRTLFSLRCMVLPPSHTGWFSNFRGTPFHGGVTSPSIRQTLAFERDPAPLEHLTQDFYATHDLIYGHCTAGPIKFVNLRVVHQSQVGGDTALRYAPSEGSPGISSIG